MPKLTFLGFLPTGLTFVDNGDGTATISGTPGKGSGGEYDLTLQASNGVGLGASQSFVLTVDETPVFANATPTLNLTLTVGTTGGVNLTTTDDYPTQVAISESGTLPSGVGFVDNRNGSGTISGKPASGAGGTYPISVTATNTAGTVTQAISILVQQAPAITSAPAATFTAGQANSFTVSSTAFPAPAFTKTGTLPAGVTFVDNGNGTATLAGSPAAGVGGIYTLTLSAANGVGNAASQTLILTVSAAPAITSASAVSFTVGTAKSFKVTTSAGYPAKTASLSYSGSLPAGLTFANNGNGTAALAGTPKSGTGGVYNLTLNASSTNGEMPQALTLTIDQAPAMRTAASATFSVGQSGSITIDSTAFPVAAFTKTGTLPSGVTFVDNGNGTATLKGTPAAGSGGVYTFSVSAANGIGSNAKQTFTLTVDQEPSITSASGVKFTIGTAQTFTVTTTGAMPAPAALSYSGTLPAGLSFTDNHNGTASLGGTAKAGTSGVYTLTLYASNIVGKPSQTLILTVDQLPAITSATSTTFTVGIAGAFTVTSTAYPTASLKETGVLPGGVTFIDNGNGTGTLSGTPAAGSGGTYKLTLAATNGVGSGPGQSFTLTVDQVPTIGSANAVKFTVGTSQTFMVTTTGAVPSPPALTYTGTLPAGLKFTDNHNGTASLAGTPGSNTGGIYTIAIAASNSTGKTTQTLTLTVDQAPAITTAAAATLTVGYAGSFTIKTTGFPTAAFSQTGALPGGVTFVDNGNGTATLAGTPRSGSGGKYTLTVIAANGVGASAKQTFTLTIDQPPAIASVSSATFAENQSNTFTVTTTGYPTAKITESGSLPSGLTFVDNGNGTATLSGKPKVKGTFSFTITASDGTLGSAQQVFDLTIQ
jgi:hypothetical protein